MNIFYFTFDNKNLYVSSNIGRDKSVIVEYDLKAKKETKVLFEHPQVDVSSLLRSEKRKVITGVAFTTWKSEYCFFYAQHEAQQNKLEIKLNSEPMSAHYHTLEAYKNFPVVNVTPEAASLYCRWLT